MTIKQEIKSFIKTTNADYFGIADISEIKDYITAQGGKDLKKYNYALSIGIKIKDDVVNMLTDNNRQLVIDNYKKFGHDLMNKELDQIALDLNKMLKNHKLNTLVIRASKRIDEQKICGKFSHKLAAHQAGLGWIGKNCLLITPDNGPRVRWVTILIEDGVEKSGDPIRERCGDCQLCTNICPPGAIKGLNFRPDQAREVRFDALKCQEYQDIRIKEPTRVCGLCIYICPYGRKD
jgi:epoxyqueuosine reductase QueG